jgi:hypothetical protein
MKEGVDQHLNLFYTQANFLEWLLRKLFQGVNGN